MNKNILIIYAHPHRKGHCGAILSSLETKLKNEKYEVLDLYKMKFNPMLKEYELLSSKYRKKVSKDVSDIQKKISASDRLIFIHPVWWYSMPAIMKGFYDRILTSGYAFKYKKVFFGLAKTSVPFLKGKKAAYFITSGSRKSFFLFVPYLWSVGFIVKGTLNFFCGIKTKIFHYGNAYIINENAKIKLDKLSSKGLKWLLK